MILAPAIVTLCDITVLKCPGMYDLDFSAQHEPGSYPSAPDVRFASRSFRSLVKKIYVVHSRALEHFLAYIRRSSTVLKRFLRALFPHFYVLWFSTDSLFSA